MKEAEVGMMLLGAKGGPRLMANPQKLGERHGAGPPTEPQKKACRHLDLRLLASRTMEQETSVVNITQCVLFVIATPAN